MTNNNLNSNNKIQNREYDLEERTAKFGEHAIFFCKQLNRDEITKPLINQLIRSSTSIGANYMEANGADSKKDFRNKISICKKESKETMHWLRMMAIAVNNKEELRILWKEANELSKIFGAINKKLYDK
jgi:four helix bundle protein